MIYPLLQLKFNNADSADLIAQACQILDKEFRLERCAKQLLHIPILLVNQAMMNIFAPLQSSIEKGGFLNQKEALARLWLHGGASVIVTSDLLEYVEEIYAQSTISLGDRVVLLNIEGLFAEPQYCFLSPEQMLITMLHREGIRTSWEIESHSPVINRQLWNVLLSELHHWAVQYDVHFVLSLLKEIEAHSILHSAITLRHIGHETTNIVSPKWDQGPWHTFTQKLRESDFNVYQIRDEPPAIPKVYQQRGPFIHHSLFDSFSEQHEGMYRPTSTDTLGIYVSHDSRSSFQKGVHLFCDRIEKQSSQGLFLELLIWHVFWHEFSHWKLDEYKDNCGKRIFLESIDIREVFCEISAIEAVRGNESFLHPSLKTPNTIRFTDTSKILEWRRRMPINPYSWFLGMLPYKNLVSQDDWFRAILWWSKKQMDIQTVLSKGKDVSLEDTEILKRILGLYMGKTTLPLAKKLLEDASQQMTLRRNWFQNPVVYLWCAQ